jgi:hypothetical protein
MFKTAVMPEQVISGAARFQDIVQGCPDLYGEALAAGVLSYGLWGVPAPDGSYQVRAGRGGGGVLGYFMCVCAFGRKGGGIRQVGLSGLRLCLLGADSLG